MQQLDKVEYAGASSVQGRHACWDMQTAVPAMSRSTSTSHRGNNSRGPVFMSAAGINSSAQAEVLTALVVGRSMCGCHCKAVVTRPSQLTKARGVVRRLPTASSAEGSPGDDAASYDAGGKGQQSADRVRTSCLRLLFVDAIECCSIRSVLHLQQDSLQQRFVC
jgi:hypothetical protein